MSEKCQNCKKQAEVESEEPPAAQSKPPAVANTVTSVSCYSNVDIFILFLKKWKFDTILFHLNNYIRFLEKKNTTKNHLFDNK